MNFKNGTIFNQYKIISAIGKGGMGEVFLAQDTRKESVALVIKNGKHKGKQGDRQFLKRGTCVCM